MYKRYHIETRPAPLGSNYIRKFRIERGEECINCARCAKACIFDVHRRREDDSRVMAEPESGLCKGCMRCVRECPRGALSICITSDYKEIGDTYFTPGVIITLWSEAEAGKLPVKGAGYKGPFSGPGFDSMLTDMSEIVRPTRDGIHGREYISTYVDLGRKLDHLSVSGKEEGIFEIPPLVDLPFPVIFEVPPWGMDHKNIRLAVAKAVSELGTLMIVNNGIKDLVGYEEYLMPRVTVDSIENFSGKSRILEIDYEEGLKKKLKLVKRRYPDTVISARVRIEKGFEKIVGRLAEAGLDAVHIYADPHGNEFGSKNPRFIKDAILSTHEHLVEKAIRNEVTLIASGGMALAEHVPKALICGADAVAIDVPYMIALGCQVCDECNQDCPIRIDAIEVDWASRRIMNLMAAWRDQLLEVMGAMGIREARRLRGELGRSMFFEDLERENFAQIEEDD